MEKQMYYFFPEHQCMWVSDGDPQTSHNSSTPTLGTTHNATSQFTLNCKNEISRLTNTTFRDHYWQNSVTTTTIKCPNIFPPTSSEIAQLNLQLSGEPCTLSFVDIPRLTESFVYHFVKIFFSDITICPSTDITWAMMFVWRLRGKIIRTVLCYAAYNGLCTMICTRAWSVLKFTCRY